MIAQNRKKRCTNFAQFFVHLQTREKTCDIVKAGEGKMRKEQIERDKLECKNLMESLEKVERQIEHISSDFASEREMRHLARLIYAGKIIEKSGLLYTFNEQSLYEFLTANKNELQKPPKKI